MSDSTLSLDTNIADIGREDFEALFESYLNTSRIKEQSVVPGRVINVDDDWVMVDVGYKAEGVIPLHEFADEEGAIRVDVGDTIDVYLDSKGLVVGACIMNNRAVRIPPRSEPVSRPTEACTAPIVPRCRCAHRVSSSPRFALQWSTRFPSPGSA